MNRRNILLSKIFVVFLCLGAISSAVYAVPDVDRFDASTGGLINQINTDGSVKSYRFTNGNVYTEGSGATCPDSLAVGPPVGFTRVISIFAKKENRQGECVTDRSLSGFVTVDATWNVIETTGPGNPPGPSGGTDPPGDGGGDDADDDAAGQIKREEELICDSEADGGNQNGKIDPDEQACLQEAFDNADTIPEGLKCKDNEGNAVDGMIQVSVGIGGGSKCIPVGDGSIETNPIITLLKTALRVMSIGVGLVVAASIVIAGIQYSASQGNPQIAAEAKKRLLNAVIGLVMFIFAFALLNFLVPGGVIGG